jgi:DNA-binding NarL/FixJ family response regulator
MMVLERVDALALRRELLEQEARLKSLVEQLLESERQREPSASTVRQTPAARSGDSIPLTKREVQILQLVVSGHTNRQIGAQLGCTSATIRNRLGRIYWKLGVMTRTHAAVRAVELGLCRVGPAEDSRHAKQPLWAIRQRTRDCRPRKMS